MILDEEAPAQRLRSLLAAADGGDVRAMTEAGLMLAKGGLEGVERDFAAAYGLYRQAAEKGFSMAQYNLACMYMNGTGDVPRDYREARRWLEKAGAEDNADQDRDAQFTLATLFERGLGGDLDLTAARKWYERAAANGSGRAQYDLACIYMHGKGVAVDKGLAVYWFEKALESGVSRAAVHLQELT